ncbi:hypothetical protein EVAR_19519_1 [Eumeta japonica]|uniref:Uncharacterized protein n=1 Tax=Eumeta variegata TaxID=151549 RepID=A0A4C1UFC1_EUMVA|nr:hypothetical protein EVAR_19519_1 [Eumeta japonica]
MISRVVYNTEEEDMIRLIKKKKIIEVINERRRSHARISNARPPASLAFDRFGDGAAGSSPSAAAAFPLWHIPGAPPLAAARRRDKSPRASSARRSANRASVEISATELRRREGAAPGRPAPLRPRAARPEQIRHLHLIIVFRPLSPDVDAGGRRRMCRARERITITCSPTVLM